MSVALLIAGFALAIFLLLEFEDLLERSLGDGRGDIILAVEILSSIVNIMSQTEGKYANAPLRPEEEHSHHERGKSRVAHRHTGSPRRFVRRSPVERDSLNIRESLVRTRAMSGCVSYVGSIPN